MVDVLDRPTEAPARQRQYGGPEARIHYLVLNNFTTMDTQQSRVGLSPQSLAWLENLQPIGRNDLVQVPGPITTLTTIASKTTLKQFYATYNGVDYAIMFMTDGSAYQVNLANGAQTLFAPAATFTNPDMAQWASDRILIADPTAGYCEWDGSVFVQPGGVSPHFTITNAGSGYTSAPGVAISGGSGSGATATAQISGGSVVNITLTAAGSGYKAGDTLTVTFSGGGGANAAATAIVWPILSIPNLSSIAVFQGRVWLAGNRTLFWTGTKGFDDSVAANASGSTIITDSDLSHSITALRSLNNFLYIFGDASLKQIGAISVAAGVTLFTVITLTSDQGTLFPQSIVSFNRLVCFTNFSGVYAVFGATVEKISDPMDGIFRLVDFTQLPVAISTVISNIRCLCVLVKYNDPVQGARPLFLTFFNRKWFVISQGPLIKTAISAVIAGANQVFTSSGGDVTRVLADATVPTTILVRTSLSDDNAPMMNKRGIRIGIAQSASVVGTMTLTTDSENSSVTDNYTFGFPIIWTNISGGVVQWQNSSLQNVNFITAGFLFQDRQFRTSGIYLGCSFMGTFAMFHLNGIVIEYEVGPMMRSINKASG